MAAEEIFTFQNTILKLDKLLKNSTNYLLLFSQHLSKWNKKVYYSEEQW